jgi:UDP-N-acetylglucosamine--N-acetylmuramyl-(pentapeptide) pyrophosphoryl-undecaprenol N-acetylglucosamine transferase
MRIAICGGGTGGHLYPLLALDDELESREGVLVDLYISEKIGVREAFTGKSLVTADLQGFKRSPLSRSNLSAVAKMVRAIRVFRRAMRASRPDIAVGFGSYASVPGMLAARSLRIPTLIHEQNAVPGAANRLLGRGARGVAVAFPGSEKVFGCKRVKVVGNPVRAELMRPASREEALRFFDLREGVFTLAVVGGSQGAQSLNQAVTGALPRFGAEQPVQIVHAAGKGKYEELVRQAAESGAGAGVTWRSYPYVDRMDLLYAAADLLLCRSGASTLAELTVLGVPSILVPYPHAAAGHQEANARVLEGLGAAVLVQDNELSGEKLYLEVKSLMQDRERLAAMAACARELGAPRSAADLADFALELAGG